MGQKTPIQWCDSVVNGMMGCDGCELWNPAAGILACYAGNDATLHAGRPGWPIAFDQPQHFPGRIEEACRWKDLRGKPREEKPWLDGLSRTIFFNDEGDTFTESLDPAQWLLPLIPAMEASAHFWLVLTKRPKRMLAFFSLLGRIPANIIPMTSVTGPGTLGRVNDLLQLRQIRADVALGLSVEPLLEDLGAYRRVVNGIDWLILGGESDQKQARARACDVGWLRSALAAGKDAGVPTFVKQLGSRPVLDGKPFPVKDSHGGNWDSWPEDLRVRQMPDVLFASREVPESKKGTKQGLLFS